jgi:hypothetical protein
MAPLICCPAGFCKAIPEREFGRDLQTESLLGIGAVVLLDSPTGASAPLSWPALLGDCSAMPYRVADGSSVQPQHSLHQLLHQPCAARQILIPLVAFQKFVQKFFVKYSAYWLLFWGTHDITYILEVRHYWGHSEFIIKLFFIYLYLFCFYFYKKCWFFK